MDTDERRNLRPDTGSHLGIPTPQEEKPITSYNGLIFKNKAYHCRTYHMFSQDDLDQAEQVWIDHMTLYLANFCEPVRNIANEVHCVSCNAQLTGPQGMADWRSRGALLVDTGSSTLEARCTSCGYPTRCKHRIELPNGQLIVAINGLPLQYHPTTLQGHLRLV